MTSWFSLRIISNGEKKVNYACHVNNHKIKPSRKQNRFIYLFIYLFLVNRFTGHSWTFGFFSSGQSLSRPHESQHARPPCPPTSRVHSDSHPSSQWCHPAISPFFLELFLHWSPVACWVPTDLGSSSFSILSFCLFILFMGVLKARILKWFAIPFSSGPHSVRPLHHDPPRLGLPQGHGLVSLS